MAGPAIDVPDDETGHPPIIVPMTYRKLLEVTHFHLFTMPVVLLIIGHLFLATSLGDRAKLLWLVAASSSVAAHLATPWIVRYAGGRVAFLHAITGMALTLTMSVLTIYPVLAMWRGDRSRNSGGVRPPRRPRAPRPEAQPRAVGLSGQPPISPDVDIQGNALETDPCLVARGGRGAFTAGGLRRCGEARRRAGKRSPARREQLHDDGQPLDPDGRDRGRRPTPTSAGTSVVDDLQCHPVSATGRPGQRVAAPDLAPVARAGRRSSSPRARCRSRTSPGTSTSTPITAPPARSCPTSRSSGR